MKKTMNTVQAGREMQERSFKRMMAYQKKSRAGSQQKENEPAHDQKGVIAYDEQKRFF